MKEIITVGRRDFVVDVCDHEWELTDYVYRRCKKCLCEKIAKEPDGLGAFQPHGTFTVGGVPWEWNWADGVLTETPKEKSVATEWGNELLELQKQFYCAISKGEKPVVYATFWTRVKGWFSK